MGIRSTLRALFREEKALAAVGLLGLALAAGTAAVALLRGTVVPPGGDLTKPIAFDAAVGIWVITIAALLPFADFGPRGRSVWRAAFAVAMVYFYAGETWPAFRGHDPRFFSDDFGSLDRWVATLFAVDAVAVILLFLVLSTRWFTRRARVCAPEIVVGARWAAVSTVSALAVGGWMIAMEGRAVGEGGSALWPHALGFHALQAVPLVGWLAQRSGSGSAPVHVAGTLWLAAVALALAQAAAGVPPLAPSAAGLAGLASLAGWAGVVVDLARRRPGNEAPAPAAEVRPPG